jgi:ubiquitin C-terminal hydrolase
MHKRINYNKKLKEKNMKKSSDTNNSSYFIIGSIIVLCVAGVIYVSQKPKADNSDKQNTVIQIWSMDNTGEKNFSAMLRKNECKLPVYSNYNSTDNTSTTNCQSHIGFRNNGNTCYQNAAIQCLLSSRPVIELVFAESNNTKSEFVKAFYETAIVWEHCLQNIWTNERIVRELMELNPLEHWSNREQRDAYIFLTDLYNKLHDILPDLKKIFNVGYKSHITCSKKHTSEKPDDAIFTSLAISGTTLVDCFTQFVGIENLTGDNQFQCKDCGSNVDATKRFFLVNQPECIVIHMNRFHNNLSKIQTSIQIPNNLEIAKYINPPPENSYMYELYGIVHHNGEYRQGHYYADCKSEKNQKWYRYDDSSVSEQEPKLDGATPYILFYQRQPLVHSGAAAAAAS